jgi:hypothetical protein
MKMFFTVRLMESMQNILSKTGYKKHRNVVLKNIRISLLSRTHRGADKSLVRPTSQCIFLMVRIFLSMLVLLYIEIVLNFLQL